MTDQFMVQGNTLGHSIFHSEQLYLDTYWILPYDLGLFLRNTHGFSILGDPAITYWPRPEEKQS